MPHILIWKQEETYLPPRLVSLAQRKSYKLMGMNLKCSILWGKSLTDLFFWAVAAWVAIEDVIRKVSLQIQAVGQGIVFMFPNN